MAAGVMRVAAVVDGGAKLRSGCSSTARSSSRSRSLAPLSPSRFPILIGADPNDTGTAGLQLVGRIDEIRISNTARYREDYPLVDRFEPDFATLAALSLRRWDRNAAPGFLRPREAWPPLRARCGTRG